MRSVRSQAELEVLDLVAPGRLRSFPSSLFNERIETEGYKIEFNDALGREAGYLQESLEKNSKT
jgi:hypothetical protein